MVLDGEPSQEYPVDARVSQGPFLFLHLHFLLYMYNLPDFVACDITIYCDGTTFFYSKCDQASDLWKQLELTSDFESDVQNTV